MHQHERTWSPYCLGPVAARIIGSPNHTNVEIGSTFGIRRETVRRLRRYLERDGRLSLARRS